VNRRFFLKGTAGGIAGMTAAKGISASAPEKTVGSSLQTKEDRRDGGIFGRWVHDEFGLPAFRYEMDQVHDPRATWNTQLLGKTNRHWHQLGNDRFNAIVSNEGWIQVYSHEFGPRWINMHRPDQRSYAGGVSFLQIGERMLPTLYRCLPLDAAVERLWGCSYSKFTIEHLSARLERTVFAPFGDSPFMVARIRITNLARSPQTMSHIEYWDLNLHNIDYNFRTPWAVDEHWRDEVSARLYFGASPWDRGYAAAWDEDLGALLARNPWAVPTSEPSLNWPSPVVDNRPDVLLVPMGIKPIRHVTEREAFLGQVSRYLPKFLEDSPAKPGTGSHAPLLASFSEHRLAPGETAVFGYAYGATPADETASEVRTLGSSVERLFASSMDAWQKYVPSADLGEPSLNRELVWSSYYLRSGGVYHRGFRAHTLPQGGAYQYLSGVNAGPRATLQHTLPLIWLAPELAKDVLRFTLAETHPSGEVPYAEVGTGLLNTAGGFFPSDNDLWLLWAVSDYVLSRRDRQFLTEDCSYWPPPYTRPEPVWEHCVRAFRHLTEVVGYGPHGLLKMRTGDWNDGIVLEGRVPLDRVWAEGESTLNSAMGVYVMRRFAELAKYAHQPSMENLVRTHAARLAEAVRASWRNGHLNRGWRDRNHEFGYLDLYLEPQPWALIAEILDKEQKNTLIKQIADRLADPLGSRVFASGGEGNPVTLFGGIWLSINSTLVWGLSKVSPERAWQELLANTLFNHARKYPLVWFGVWSGPDSYLASNSKRPGETWSMAPVQAMQAWPVQILFPHSETLNATLWMLGIEATAEGISIHPRVPFDRWSWSGAGFSLSYTQARVHGSISGVGPELTQLELQLPRGWEDSSLDIEEGGVKRKVDHAGPSVRLNLRVAPNEPAQFAVNKG
jgi:Glycosyl hydrolase 36 superfamily, catalytic domain